MKTFKTRTQESGGSLTEAVFGSLLEVIGKARMSHSGNLGTSILEVLS